MATIQLIEVSNQNIFIETWFNKGVKWRLRDLCQNQAYALSWIRLKQWRHKADLYGGDFDQSRFHEGDSDQHLHDLGRFNFSFCFQHF